MAVETLVKEHEKLHLEAVNTTDIVAPSVNELIQLGIEHIKKTGAEINSRSGKALQSYNVNYILTDSRNRVQNSREGAVKYFARELIAYFNGSLKAHNGLTKASNFWSKLTDGNGNINSNYGYYVFYQNVPEINTDSQYKWVLNMLLNNPNSRRAIININQGMHKTSTKDFPCTVSLSFYIKSNHLCCRAFSRSTDIITGLPYDIGFFSFITELLYEDLKKHGMDQLQLGYTMISANFTQIYDRTKNKLEDLNPGNLTDYVKMPKINDAEEVLKDIYNGTYNSDVLKWISEKAE